MDAGGLLSYVFANAESHFREEACGKAMSSLTCSAVHFSDSCFNHYGLYGDGTDVCAERSREEIITVPPQMKFALGWRESTFMRNVPDVEASTAARSFISGFRWVLHLVQFRSRQ